MASRAYRLPSPYEHIPLRRRAGGFALAIALDLLVILLLIGLNRRPETAPPPERGMTVVNVGEEPQESPPQARRQPREQAASIKPPKIILPVKPTIAPPPPAKPSALLELTRDELKTTDQALASAAAAAGGRQGSPDDTPVVGHGPNGETLYAAEWLREPTNQELDAYLPANAGDGYGIIACKTYPQFRVDDCIPLESHPASSRLARAVLNAAWQFKVRPPRKNGQPMIGEWVTIRIEYVHSERTP